MKKIAILAITTLFAVSNLFCLEVNKSELNSTQNETIEFINYMGPHKVIDSAASIKGIGSGLGENIKPTVSSEAGSRDKYYVVHAVDTNSTEGKLNADILFIGKDATVDHVDNLRRIISGYLSAAYGYSEKDANTLSVFITVYNAVYRGKYDVFQSKYNNVVIKNISQSNCGLSVNYKDWPGQSEIIIPLFDVENGGLSTVDTSVIADSKVVDSMQEDDDRNIESRKDMVDLKEREADEAQEKAQEAQKEAVQEQKVLNETKKEADEAQKKAEEARKEADEAKKEAEANPNDKKAQEKAAETEKKAVEEEKKAEEKKEAVEEQQKKTEAAKEQAKETQEIADKKQTEAQNERKEIAKDQQEIQQIEREQARMNSEYGIIIVDEKNLLSRLVKFNTETGEIIKKSPVSVIRNRTIYAAGEEEFIAIAGDNAGNGTIKLVLIDQDNMEIVRESNETIAEDSVLVRDGDDYYCVIDDNGKFVVARYNQELSLRLKSNVSVKSKTPITVTPSGIVVTDPNGQLILLSKADLSAITKRNKNDAGNAK